MKLTSAIAIFLAMPVIAFGSTCYEPVLRNVPAEVPAKLCLESISESNTLGKLKVVSGDINMPEELNIVSLSRHNEDRLNFVAEAMISEDEGQVCSYATRTDIQVIGEVQTGSINPKALTITVTVASTNDTCHTPMQEESYTYSYIK
jgi:hypothetical protein